MTLVALPVACPGTVAVVTDHAPHPAHTSLPAYIVQPPVAVAGAVAPPCSLCAGNGWSMGGACARCAGSGKEPGFAPKALAKAASDVGEASPPAAAPERSEPR